MTLQEFKKKFPSVYQALDNESMIWVIEKDLKK